MTDLSKILTRLSWARLVTLILYGALLVSFSVWQITRTTGPSYFFWVVQSLPLLIFLPGMVSNNPKTYILLCFVILMYFVQGVTGVVSPARLWIDYMILIISILLFISAMLTSRWAAMSQSRNQSL